MAQPNASSRSGRKGRTEQVNISQVRFSCDWVTQAKAAPYPAELKRCVTIALIAGKKPPAELDMDEVEDSCRIILLKWRLEDHPGGFSNDEVVMLSRAKALEYRETVRVWATTAAMDVIQAAEAEDGEEPKDSRKLKKQASRPAKRLAERLNKMHTKAVREAHTALLVRERASFEKELKQLDKAQAEEAEPINKRGTATAPIEGFGFRASSGPTESVEDSDEGESCWAGSDPATAAMATSQSSLELAREYVIHSSPEGARHEAKIATGFGDDSVMSSAGVKNPAGLNTPDDC